MTIWFTTVYKELSAKRNCIAGLYEQLRLHERIYALENDGTDMHSAFKMMETSRMLCREAAKSYNRILHKPMYRIPALIMGFRDMDGESS